VPHDVGHAQKPDFQNRPQTVYVVFQQVATAGPKLPGRHEDVIDSTFVGEQRSD